MHHNRNAASAEEAAIPWHAFAIGSIASGATHAQEDYGLTVDLAADDNVVGLVSPGQVRQSEVTIRFVSQHMRTTRRRTRTCLALRRPVRSAEGSCACGGKTADDRRCVSSSTGALHFDHV